ncbi:MAG: DUF4340 domain-containing protein [Planctomycetaceae bacterium]|nr:DUF4340 domain-containing protein [Planctomycetaceae bacterium]
MSNEKIKTGAWVVAAVVLGGMAFLNLPKAIEMESQAKVNTPMFAEYQPSTVWQIEIQQPPSADFKQRNPDAAIEKLTVKRHPNRGWEMVEYDSYPAENSAKLGVLSAMLNDLKILEVVSESASDRDLAEYGLLPPDASEATDAQKGTRVILSTSGQEVVGDLLVGKPVVTNDQTAATAYVRPSADKVIYRVALNKSEVSAAMVEWTNPNVLGIKGPPNVRTFGPTYRIVEQMDVATPQQGRAECDPYRAEFKFGDQVALVKLSAFENSQWASTALQRLPSSVEFVQGWRHGLDLVSTLLIPAYVKRKSPELQSTIRTGQVSSDSDLRELKGLGFAVEAFADGSRLVGETGLLSVVTRGGIRFHFAVGRSLPDRMAPVVVYVDLVPDSGLAQPVLGQLPAESVDWPEDRKASETETLQRDFNRQMEEWKLYNQQRGQDLANLNERLAPWIFYMPYDYVVQAMPSFRLTQTATPAPDTTTNSAEEKSGQ